MNNALSVTVKAQVEGNTEVYAMACTSGYSLGFTFDVPGLQKLAVGTGGSGQYSRTHPSHLPTHDGQLDGRTAYVSKTMVCVVIPLI